MSQQDRPKALPQSLQERRFQDLVENTLDIVWETDARGSYTYVSPNAASLLGYAPSEMLGKSPFDFMPPEEASRVGALFASYASQKKAFSLLAHKFRAKDGSIRVLECGGRPIPGEDGCLAGYRGIDRDVTERARLAEALKLSEEYFRRMFEESPIGMALPGEDLKLSRTNRAFREMLGYSEEELKGLSVLDITHPEDRELSLELVRKLFSGEVPSSRIEKRYLRKDGRALLAQVTVAAFRSADGRTHPLAMIEDITERKRLQEEFLHAEKLAAMSQFAGGLAHELNNVMTGIMGFASLVKHELGEGHPCSEDVEEILSASHRARDLVSQILAFGRRRKPVWALLDLNEQVRQALRMLAPILGERIELKTLLEPGLPRLSADPAQIKQVIANLCLNARDAIADEGTLAIETRTVDIPEGAEEGPKGRCVLLSVSDTGCGMDAATLPKIFDPFFTTKKQAMATGLGLSVVHGIVKEQGGRIAVESQPGKGSTFRITLPAHQEQELPRPGEGPKPSAAVSATILLAEDDPAPRKMLLKAFKSSGYEVLVAADGEEAVRLFAADKDLVGLAVLDVVMPKLSGPEAFERMAAMKPGLKAVFVSGYAEPALQEAVKKTGQPFLAKPFEPEELLRKVREILES